MCESNSTLTKNSSLECHPLYDDIRDVLEDVDSTASGRTIDGEVDSIKRLSPT